MTKAKDTAKAAPKGPKASQTQTQPGDDSAKGLNATSAGAASSAPAAAATSTPTAQDPKAGENNTPNGGKAATADKKIYNVQWRLLRDGEEYLPGRSLALTEEEAGAIGDVLVLAKGE